MALKVMAEEDCDPFGFEQGMSWLPARILHEACEDRPKVDVRDQRKHHRHQQHHSCPKPPPAAEPLLPLYPKSGSKPPHQRSRFCTNWAAAGGPGMQAIFLDSGQRSCGTGVFLPRIVGTDSQPTKKPACSPVLLPARVVKALNLNVHEIGSQIKPPHRDKNNNNSSKGRHRNSTINKKENEIATEQYCVISQSRSSSPEIFLPKEWTY